MTPTAGQTAARRLFDGLFGDGGLQPARIRQDDAADGTSPCSAIVAQAAGAGPEHARRTATALTKRLAALV